MTPIQRDKTIAATRVTDFEHDLLKAVEEKVGSQASVVRLGVLYAAYQQLGAAHVAAIRTRHRMSFDDMRAMYVDPTASLSPVTAQHLVVDGIVGTDG